MQDTHGVSGSKKKTGSFSLDTNGTKRSVLKFSQNVDFDVLIT